MGKDLRSFIAELARLAPDDVVRVKREVSPDYEPVALAVKLEKQGRFPLLFFERVRGSNFPMVMNVHAKRRNLALALGTTETDLGDEYARREAGSIPPVLRDSGPVKEVIHKGKEVDVRSLPLLRHNAKDDAPYITMGVTICKNPQTRKVNVGLYRNRLLERDKIGLFYAWGKDIHYFHQRLMEGQRPLEVAIVIGMHPAVYMASQSLRRSSAGDDEYEVAGSLLGEPLEVVKCETVDLEVPAHAEIVIEGELIPGSSQHEGPFGEYTGYYGQEVDTPILQIKAITHRADAIYQDVAASYNEHVMLAATPRESSLLRVLRSVVPTVRHVHIPTAGVLFHAYVSMKKVNEGDAKNVLLTALGAEHRLTLAIAVDEDIDAFNEREVIWAVATRTHLDHDVFVVPWTRGNRLNPMTHDITRMRRDGLSAKMGIDATLPIGLPYELPERVQTPMVDEIDPAEYLAPWVSSASQDSRTRARNPSRRRTG